MTPTTKKRHAHGYFFVIMSEKIISKMGVQELDLSLSVRYTRKVVSRSRSICMSLPNQPNDNTAGRKVGRLIKQGRQFIRENPVDPNIPPYDGMTSYPLYTNDHPEQPKLPPAKDKPES